MSEFYRVKKSTLDNLAIKVGAKTGKTGGLTVDDTMLTALDTLPDKTYPVADLPETMGKRACLARAAQMRELKWKTVGKMPNYYPSAKYYPANTTKTGIFYSSVRANDNFIGQDVSLHTFMTALHNPNSVLYTKDYNTVYKPEGIANGVEGTWYGTNCSSFVGYALGMPYHPATSEIPLYDSTEIEGVDNLRLCDYLNSNKRYTNGGKAAGHTVLITGIWRDKEGKVERLEITDHGMHSTPAGRVIKTEVTRDDFVSTYVDTYHYRFYRYNRLYECQYTPSPYVPLFDEPAGTVVYSDICTDLGDKACLTTEESVTVQPLNTGGYTSIVVYKDGVEIKTINLAAWSGSAWAAGEGVFNKPEAGHYIAVMVKADGDTTATATNSTRWLVCAVGAHKDGDRYYFAHDTNCQPLAIVFKDGSGLIGADGGKGMTLGYFEPTEEDVARGYMSIDLAAHLAQFDDTEDYVKWVAVSYSNEYGCCHYGYAYTAEESGGGGSGESGVLPANYHRVDKITTDGVAYIDTGVSAADYPDGIRYTFKGKFTRFASGNNYIFGVLVAPEGSSTKVRTGNLTYNSTDNRFGVMCGNTSVMGATYPIEDADFENTEKTPTFTIVVEASALDGTVTLSYEGNKGATASITKSTALPTAPIQLFTVNGASGTFTGECEGFKMESIADGTVIRDYIPVYDDNGNVGMYDLNGLSKTFYGNAAGSGGFTIPDAVRAIPIPNS